MHISEYWFSFLPNIVAKLVIIYRGTQKKVTREVFPVFLNMIMILREGGNFCILLYNARYLLFKKCADHESEQSVPGICYTYVPKMFILSVLLFSLSCHDFKSTGKR